MSPEVSAVISRKAYKYCMKTWDLGMLMALQSPNKRTFCVDLHSIT